MTRLEELPARIDDLTSQVSQLRTDMRDEFSAVCTEMGGLRNELREEIRDVATQMRVLHEEVIGRIALLQEGLAGPKRPPMGWSNAGS